MYGNCTNKLDIYCPYYYNYLETCFNSMTKEMQKHEANALDCTFDAAVDRRRMRPRRGGDDGGLDALRMLYIDPAPVSRRLAGSGDVCAHIGGELSRARRLRARSGRVSRAVAVLPWLHPGDAERRPLPGGDAGRHAYSHAGRHAAPTQAATPVPTPAVTPAPDGGGEVDALAQEVVRPGESGAHLAGAERAEGRRRAQPARRPCGAREIVEVFSHTRPDGSSWSSVSASASGENIAKGQRSADG